MPLDAVELTELIESQAVCLQLWVRSRCAAWEDVVQEAFCRLAVQEPPPDKPVSWLYRVCRNLAEKQRLSDHRRRQRERTHAKSEVTSNDGPDSQDVEDILAAVEMLSTDRREVLVARIWGQLSLEEIGALCGISASTAFRRYEAALKELRSNVSPDDDRSHTE
jgi:RNA polymerase sigma-70 factor (ECF subfamily)